MAESTGGGPTDAPPAPSGVDPDRRVAPAPRSRPRIAPLPPTLDAEPPPAPETSSRSVQGVMLGLGTLLLGVAAVAFVGVLGELDPWGRLVILLGVALLALAAPVPLAARGLTATAEAIAVVGLVLIGVAAYALWTTGAVTTLPARPYAGLAAAVTAGVGYGYHRLTRLPVPRFAGLVLLQGVLPLFAYDVATRPTDWALVLTLVAAQNAALGHADLRLDLPFSRRHLRYLAWALHGVALLVAAGFAVAGLLQGRTVGATLGATATLLLVAGVGQAGALMLRHAPLPEVAAGALTLAFLGGAARVLTVALPDRAILPVTGLVVLTAAALPLLPVRARRGAAAAVGLSAVVLGALLAALAVWAGLATVTAVLPPWRADLSGYQAHLAEAVAGYGWQLPTATAALTAAAAVVPSAARRDTLVTTGALTALAVPAGYGLGPTTAPWVPLVAAAALGVTALGAPTRRAATVHLAAAGCLAATAVGAGLARPVVTATVLAALTVTALVVAWGRPGPGAAGWVTEWATGTALLAFPATVTVGAVTLGLTVPRVLTAGATAVCVSLGYAAWVRLREPAPPTPVLGGAGLAAALLAVCALAAPPAAVADRAVALLLAAAAALVVSASRLDAARPASWRYDASQLAAAAVTAGVVATLARVTSLVLPAAGAQTALAVGALLILLVALGIRAMPAGLRRGPVLGLAAFAAVVAGVATAAAVVGAARTVSARWGGDLAAWPPEAAWWGVSWSAPFALVTLAVAAGLVLPSPVRHGVTAGLVLLGVAGAPAALGLAWWAPTVLGLAVGAGYALAAALARRADPRAAQVHAGAAALLGVYALVTAAGQRWLLAATLGAVTVTAVLTAGLVAARPEATTGQRRIGGAAVTVALLATPAGLATFASHLGHPTQVLLLTSLAGSSLGLAALAVLAHRIDGYLGYGTVGVAAASTGTALLTLATPHQPGVYAAAAALLGVLAELVRAGAATGRAGAADGVPTVGPAAPGRPGVGLSPVAGAAAAAAAPTVLALIGVAPALSAVLVAPYQVLVAPWEGPPDALVAGPSVGAPGVLATLLLTLAAALAAVGFGGPVTRQTVPVVAPGLAVTLLITPAALGAPWPSGTAAALAVAALAASGVALTPPPPPGYWARPLRVTRRTVLAIAVAAGGAGLAGSLATPGVTWAALAVVVVVGAVAALGGRTPAARLTGWWSALLGAHLWALHTGLLAGLSAPQAAFGVLGVVAVALAALPRLPRFRGDGAPRELRTVEWVGGYLGLVVALGLAATSLADLAAVLIAAGAVTGAGALRPGRSHASRRTLLWTAAAGEITALWIIMRLAEVALVEAYSLPFALCALVVGWLETRHRPGVSSWVAYGPALVAALGPSLVTVLLAGQAQPARQAWVLLGGVAAILVGSRRAQRAPLIIGALVTAVGALHLLSLAGPWLMLIPIGLVLLILGANNERRQRDLERLRGAYSRMR